MEKTTLTVKELESYLNISRATSYELVNTPGFPAFRIGRKILVNIELLNHWIKEKCLTPD